MNKIRYWWDNQDPRNKGWYVEVKNEDGHYLNDSMKAWFPIDVDEFTITERNILENHLRGAYPDAEIEFVNT